MYLDHEIVEKAIEMYVPLYIDFSGLRVLVFGCGSVGVRRAVLFSRAGAAVTMVCKNPREKLDGIDLKIVEVRQDDLRSIESLVKDYDLVVVALDDEQLALSIARMALSMRKFVNNAVNHKEGNVVIPLRLTVEGIDIGLTSYGTSVEAIRRVANKVKTLLENDIETKTFVHVSRILKKCIKGTVHNHRERMNLYRAIFRDRDFNRYISQGDISAALSRAMAIAEDLNLKLDTCLGEKL